MANKTADAIKLNLRLPKPLHKRLKQQARRNNVSLNTEIVNQLSNPLRLSNPKTTGIPFYVLKDVRVRGLESLDLKSLDLSLIQPNVSQGGRDLPEPVTFVPVTDLEAAKTRIAALEDEVAHLRGQAESEGRGEHMRAVLEREKGEEQK